jgi:hypothetical protein
MNGGMDECLKKAVILKIACHCACPPLEGGVSTKQSGVPAVVHNTANSSPCPLLLERRRGRKEKQNYNRSLQAHHLEGEILA